ncbi:MAG: hypothetical protein AB8G22_17645 [Saprospiraceae bacterium]
MKNFFLQIAIYATVFFALNLALGYWLWTYETEDMRQANLLHPAQQWSDFYKNEPQTVDALVLGSSHAYRAYRPAVFEKELAFNTFFNFGSAAQSPITSHFILKEVLQTQRPKVVIFDLYYMVFTSNDQLKNGLPIYSELQAGSAKDAFLKNGFSWQEQLQFRFFPTYVYRQYFPKKVNKMLGRSYLPPPDKEYGANGFVFSTDTIALAKLQYDNQFARYSTELDQLTATNLMFFEKTIALCKKEGIPIVLMSAPLPELSIQKIKNYMEFSTFFTNTAQRLEVDYYDFSVDRLADIRDEEHFVDDDHLNLSGADLYSTKVAAILKKYQQ